MGKNILIVTGSDYSPQVYEAFKDAIAMGHTLYLLSDGSFTPTSGIFKEHFTYDLRKTRETLEYMKGVPVNFDAVTIKTSEWLTPLTALLAKMYGCIGNDPKVAFYCRSKYHMRKILKEAGIPIPEFRLCKDFNELKSAVDDIGIPCVAKPVGGNASYGTFMIKDESDIKKLKKNYDESIEYLKKKAIDQDVFAFSPDEMDLIGIKDHVDMVTDYLVEGFMSGHEISIDAITQNGKTVTMGIADQVRMKPPYFVQLAEKMPYVCNDKTKADIDKLVARTVEAMGIRNSASHTEIIFTPEGPKIVEIGCRIGGDNIHDFVFQTTGYNLMFESIMIALGVERKYDVKIKCHAAMEYILPEKNGVIKKITIPEDVRKDPNVTEIEMGMKEGDTVSPPPQSFDFIGYISAKGAIPEEAQKNLMNALSRITINIGPK